MHTKGHQRAVQGEHHLNSTKEKICSKQRKKIVNKEVYGTQMLYMYCTKMTIHRKKLGIHHQQKPDKNQKCTKLFFITQRIYFQSLEISTLVGSLPLASYYALSSQIFESASNL